LEKPNTTGDGEENLRAEKARAEAEIEAGQDEDS
jgi:hypothetical protein